MKINLGFSDFLYNRSKWISHVVIKIREQRNMCENEKEKKIQNNESKKQNRRKVNVQFQNLFTSVFWTLVEQV